jgi:hypothetical protein
MGENNFMQTTPQLINENERSDPITIIVSDCGF